MIKHMDRNYLRMLFDDELIELTKHIDDDLAIVLAERLQEVLDAPSRFVEHLGR